MANPTKSSVDDVHPECVDHPHMEVLNWGAETERVGITFPRGATKKFVGEMLTNMKWCLAKSFAPEMVGPPPEFADVGGRGGDDAVERPARQVTELDWSAETEL